MDPVKAAEWSKALNAWHEAHWKPIIERANAADKVWRLANKDMFDAKKAAFDAKKAAWEKFKNTNDTLFKDMDVAKDIMDKIDEFTAKGSKDDNGDA
jgi:conjugal transfer/entry exclusion protein